MHETMRAFHQIHMEPAVQDLLQRFSFAILSQMAARRTPLLYSLFPKENSSSIQKQCWNTQYQVLIQSKVSLAKLPTMSTSLQVAQTWELPSKSDCIRQCEMKKFLFRDQDFTIINAKKHEFRLWDYTASYKFWNGNLKLIEFIKQLWSINRL